MTNILQHTDVHPELFQCFQTKQNIKYADTILKKEHKLATTRADLRKSCQGF